MTVTALPPAYMRARYAVPVAAVAAAATGLLAWSVSGADRTTLAVAAAVPIAAVAAAMAYFRFDLFLLGLLALRPLFDLLNVRTQAAMIDPADAVGVVFIVAASLWLLKRWRSGEWRPVSPAIWGCAFFVAAAGASVLVSGAPIWSAMAVAKVVAGVLMFVVLEQLLYDRVDLAWRIAVAVLVSAVGPAILALWQWSSSTGNSAYADVSRVAGTFVHPNPFATYLGLVLVLSLALATVLRGWQQTAVLSYAALLAVLLGLTYARAGWIAALVAIAFLMAKIDRRLVLVLLVVVFAAGMAVPSLSQRIYDLSKPAPIAGAPSNSLSWRTQYWQDVLPLARANPVDGIGLEMVQRSTREGLPPHNVFVQAYTETGLIGLVGLLCMIAGFAVSIRRRLAAAEPGPERAFAWAAAGCALALLVQTPTENLLTQTMVYWYFAAAGAFGLRVVHRRASED